MNLSTRRLIRDSERWNSKEAMKHARTKMLCIANPEHGLQAVVDFLPLQRKAKLACTCKRDIFLTTETTRQEFEQAQALQRKRDARRVESADDDWAKELRPYSESGAAA